MAGWSEVETEAPELSALARELLLAHTHLTLATLRKDGSPRISGTEIILAEGELWLGSMPKAVKALDLQRDPRFAVHSGSDDPDKGWKGDAKFAGRVEEIEDDERKRAIVAGEAPPGPLHLFRCDLTELVVVRLGEPADHLVIESWHEGRGVSRLRR
ncbi:MAG: pyridoxamine 5'-phosphate oxidase family protein [Thermoleophilaceae bacterium]